MHRSGLVRFYLLLLFSSVAGLIYSQKINIKEAEYLMDDHFGISVSNLAPKQAFIIRASMKDSTGRLWVSYAGFYADHNGNAELDKISPVNGTYSGMNSMGLIQSMNLPGPDYNKQRFLYGYKNSIPVKFKLEIDGKTVDSIIIVRNFIKKDTKIIELRQDGMVGALFYPASKKNIDPVVVLGGSEGGLSGEDVAATLSNHGFAVLALAYFNSENLPSALNEIPIEYFSKAIDWMQNLDFVSKNGVTILATSKGSEAALLTAANNKNIKGVVAYVPSNVAWSCICNEPTNSSWSYSGKPVAFVKQASDPTYKPQPGFSLQPSINYLYRLNNTNNFNEVVIPVEKINGPILLISGKQDQLWPSDFMSDRIVHRLKRYNYPFWVEHLSYENAGHLIGKLYLPSGSTLIAGGRIETGGTPEGNAFAQQDSWPRVIKFLKKISN